MTKRSSVDFNRAWGCERPPNYKPSSDLLHHLWMSIEKTIGDWTQCWPAIHRGNDALAPSVMETALNFSYWLSCVAVATRRARQVASRSPWCFGRQRLLASSDLVHGQLDSGSPVSIQRTVCCLLSRRVLRVHPAERVDVDAVRASDCLSNVNNAARL